MKSQMPPLQSSITSAARLAGVKKNHTHTITTFRKIMANVIKKLPNEKLPEKSFRKEEPNDTELLLPLVMVQHIYH